MELANLNPFVRYAGNPINLRPQSFRSYCYDCRLFFIRQGSGTMEIRSGSHDFHENTLIYLPPGTDYRFLPKESTRLSLLVFDFDLVADFAHLKASLGTAQAAKADTSKSPVYPIPQAFSAEIIGYAPGLLSPLEQCIRDFLTKAPYCRETASAVIKNALLELLKGKRLDRDRQLSGQVMEYIHDHYQDPELCNTQIAEQFGYHPYYLSQLLKKTTGKTLHNYLLYYRLRMAKNYLITTDWDIETVSWNSGFNSVSYFIKLFRQSNGVTPGKYRKIHGNNVF